MRTPGAERRTPGGTRARPVPLSWPPLLAVATVVAIAAACGGDDDGGPTDPEDTTAPSVRIVFPVDSIDEFSKPATLYDETGNGLIDVRATLSDTGSGVDPSTARIEVLGQIAGSAGSGEDLTGLWTEVERDAGGLTFEETYEELVRHGAWRLVVSVADVAGNRGADTIDLVTQPGDYHRTVELDYLPGDPTGDMIICEDDDRLYARRGFGAMVFDALTLELIGTFPDVMAEPPARLLCIPGDPILYATVRVERFDRTTFEWDREIPGTFRTDGIAHSRLDPDIIWAGEWGIGVPTQVDKSLPERIGEVGLPHSSSSQEFTVAVAVLDDDRKIYYSRAREGGLVVGDPATGEQLAHVDLDPFAPGLGLTDNIVVGHDDRFVYAAVQGQESGAVEIDTDSDVVTRRVAAIDGVGIDVAIHPTKDLLWLTTHDDDPAVPTPSLLIDAEKMEWIERFPRPVPEGTETRWVLAAVFHPDGKLLYQARDDDIDVYLIR